MADALEASCADLVGAQLSNLSTEANDHSPSPFKITAADCTQVAAMAQAVELRDEPVQCDFGPQLDPNTPATCGAGTGSKSSYLADFEAGLGDWTTSVDSVFGGPTDEWKFTGDLPEGNKPPGSTGAAFGPLSDEGTCTGDATDGSMVTYLTSPDIVVGEAGDVADSARLTFDHNIETELGFDGGTVQISTDGGTSFDTIPADAYLFNGPTVLATEAEGNTNPLAGEDGFTGTDGGKIVSDWGTSIVDLSSLGVALGDTIQLRYAAGRDGCGGALGWWVDNVAVSTCVQLTPSNIAAVHVPEPSTYGSASSVNVTVTGTGGPPTGTVTVKEGATTLGTATLSATGTASVALPTTLAAGAHALTATYNGDNTFDAKTTNVTATVSKAASTTTASAPKKVKRKKDFDVTVAVAAPGGTPAGTVEVFDGAKLLGTGTLVNGTVKITVTKNLKKGKHTLTVKYSGSANVAASQTTVDVKIKKKKKS